jgi:phosphatidylserine/phosphatidylglycerophosphate/cardiolipin synthase-like enzyme
MKATAPLDKDQLQVRVFQPQRRHSKDGKESWPAALHAKMGVSDNLIAWVGSQNLTENSQTYYEAISVVRYPAAVQKQLDTIQAWWELGIEFDPGLPQLLGARATKLLGARTVTTSRSGHGTKHRDPSAS